MRVTFRLFAFRTFPTKTPLCTRFDASWEEIGCHSTDTGFTRCTCAADLCNAPFTTKIDSRMATSSAADATNVAFAGVALSALIARNIK